MLGLWHQKIQCNQHATAGFVFSSLRGWCSVWLLVKNVNSLTGWRVVVGGPKDSLDCASDSSLQLLWLLLDCNYRLYFAWAVHSHLQTALSFSESRKSATQTRYGSCALPLTYYNTLNCLISLSRFTTISKVLSIFCADFDNCGNLLATKATLYNMHLWSISTRNCQKPLANSLEVHISPWQCY